MIKLLYFCDLHFSHVSPESRTESYGDDILKKLKEIVQIANKGKMDATLFGGDLFHRKHEVSMAEVREVIAVLKKLKSPLIGILGNHDVAAYQKATKNNRAAGVLEAAGIIQWVDLSVSKHIKDCAVISGAPYSKDYENLKSYGKGCAGKRTKKSDILIWLSHGLLIQDGTPPYEHTKIEDVLKSTDADIVLNGHYHTELFEAEIKGKKSIICPGGIGRVARNDLHHPSVVLLGINEKDRTWKHKIIQLKSARKSTLIFLQKEEQSKSSDEDIREFAETLAKDSEDLQSEDLKAVVDKACSKRKKEVKEAVLSRLGV